MHHPKRVAKMADLSYILKKSVNFCREDFNMVNHSSSKDSGNSILDKACANWTDI